MSQPPAPVLGPRNTSRIQERHRNLAGLLLIGLVVLAAVLRFWRLGDWGFEGDEIYTLRDSLRPRLTNPRPLIYFLNHFLIGPLMPLNELGLRILPALFGVLAIPAFYLVARRLFGTRAALFGTLLLAVNPLHVYQSQYARYWSLVVLMSAVYPYAIYVGVRERNAGWLTLGLITAVLAVLAHPVSLLLMGGLALFLLLQLRRDTVRDLWRHQGVRWGALVLVILAVIAGARSISLLENWIAAHDAKTWVPDRVFPERRPPIIKQLGIFLAFAEGLTLPVTLLGALGICQLWQREDRSKALLLACLFAFPVLFILAVSFRVAVSPTYFLPAAPVIFLAAGLFLSRLADVDLGLRPRWLVPAALTAVVLIPGVPTLISQYRDGRRFDFRGAAQWLEPRLAPGDRILSEQYRLIKHYLPGLPVEAIPQDTASMMRAMRALHRSGEEPALWLVAPAPSHAFRGNLKRGGVLGWIYENCQLRNTLGVSRIDFRQQYLQVYRCPPAKSGAIEPAEELQPSEQVRVPAGRVQR